MLGRKLFPSTQNPTPLKNFRAFAYDRPGNVGERVARRAPPESRERGDQHTASDAVTRRLRLDDSPRVLHVAQAWRSASRQKNCLHVNARPEDERQIGRA